MLQKQLFSTKYLNAEIRDEEKGFYIRHIKHRIGPFFLTKIGEFYYCFRINEEIYKTKERGIPKIEVSTYHTNHYLPLDDHCKLLELTLEKNDINKVDPMMADIFKELAKKEKSGDKFTPHDLDDMIKEVSGYEKSKIGKIIPKSEQKYLIKKKMILNYLNNLDKKQIVTPVRSISNFIEGQLRTTDPQFLANIHLSLGTIDHENKKVTNQPITKGRPWLKYIALGILAIMIVAVIMYAYQNHWFDTITNIGQGFSGLPSPVGGFQPANQKTDQWYQDNYTPQELRDAIDAGEIKEDTLPPITKEMVKGIPSRPIP